MFLADTRNRIARNVCTYRGLSDPATRGPEYGGSCSGRVADKNQDLRITHRRPKAEKIAQCRCYTGNLRMTVWSHAFMAFSFASCRSRISDGEVFARSSKIRPFLQTSRLPTACLTHGWVSSTITACVARVNSATRFVRAISATSPWLAPFSMFNFLTLCASSCNAFVFVAASAWLTWTRQKFAPCCHARVCPARSVGKQ